jgi:hypothetical protein
MRLASKELEAAQEQAEERRVLLVSGRIRLSVEQEKPLSEPESRHEIAPQPESE